MHGKRCGQQQCAQQQCLRCRSELGSVMPFVVAGMTTLLLFLILAIDQGVLYAGRTQLQQLSDSASRAALLALAEPNSTRADAITAANTIAANTSLMQGGNARTNLQVEFGSFDFAASGDGFVPEAMPLEAKPQAVRVTTSKTGENALRSLLTGSVINANAEGTAALRCRNIVILQDVSSSFRDDIGKIQDALRKTLQLLADQQGTSSISNRVGLVAFRNRVVAAATTPRMVPATDASIRNAINALDDPGVVCNGSVERRGIPPFVEYFVPACVGTDLIEGLEAAENLLAPGNGKLGTCQDLILTVTDGVPCRIETEAELTPPGFLPGFVHFQQAPPGEPTGGGSTKEDTLRYVQQDMSPTLNIAVLTANSARTPPQPSPFILPSEAEATQLLGVCPIDQLNSRNRNNQLDIEFANGLIQGFGRAFQAAIEDRSQMAEQMSSALRSIPPVLVR